MSDRGSTERPGRRQDRFDGSIAGAGSTSGVRVVVGHWPVSPFGAFTDVMVETAAGHRVLLAPSRAVADFVSATYTFDEQRVEDVRAEIAPGWWRVRSSSLSLDLGVAGRRPLGVLLRLVPRWLATRPSWTLATDPVARVVLRGVRTRGAAREGRREYYAATDLHRVVALGGSFDGVRLGELWPVDPPCRFGFSSTPRAPSVARVVTTVR